MKTLLAMQTEMKVPKTKKNLFGNFMYRSFEDVLEAAKPVLIKYDAQLLVTDDVLQCGDMVFIKATATLKVGEETFVTTGFARIDTAKKGMDAAQVTGCASSYARKYALGALFLIDNEQDPDALPPSQTAPAPAVTPAPPPPGRMYGIYTPNAPAPPPAPAAPGYRPPPPPPPAQPNQNPA